MKKAGKEKWLHNRGYLAELTYERPTKNFTAPSFSSHVYPQYYHRRGFSMKYFHEHCKLRFLSLEVLASRRDVAIRKIRTCLKRHYYCVVVNKAKEYKIIEQHERSKYFSSVSMAKATHFFPLTILPAIMTSFAQHFFFKGDNQDIVTKHD